jgi:hypothetical protein
MKAQCEYSYSSIQSTLALGGGEWSTSCPGCFSLLRTPVLTGQSPEPVWMVFGKRKSLTHSNIRSPDRPAYVTITTATFFLFLLRHYYLSRSTDSIYSYLVGCNCKVLHGHHICNCSVQCFICNV